VASLSQGRTAAAQCGLFTYKSVPVIFEPPCIIENVASMSLRNWMDVNVSIRNYGSAHKLSESTQTIGKV